MCRLEQSIGNRFSGRHSSLPRDFVPILFISFHLSRAACLMTFNRITSRDRALKNCQCRKIMFFLLFIVFMFLAAWSTVTPGLTSFTIRRHSPYYRSSRIFLALIIECSCKCWLNIWMTCRMLLWFCRLNMNLFINILVFSRCVIWLKENVFLSCGSISVLDAKWPTTNIVA